MRLTTTGVAENFTGSITGVIATAADTLPDQRSTKIRLVTSTDGVTEDSLTDYRAVLFAGIVEKSHSVRYIHRLRECDHLKDGDIVVLEGAAGLVRSLYRPYEKHHHLFVTERCNSNCLMCSQPPKDWDDTEGLTARNIEVIELIDSKPPYLTITGGEPTLLGDNLFRIIELLKVRMPDTELHILTNGRTFAWPQFTRRFAALDHQNISLGIPLYSDTAGSHDFVVQARGAFDQTIAGLHQCARNRVRVEIRIVLHALTIPRLQKLAEFIYRNLTFAEHVAFMGLEYTGYTPRNIAQLWIDPYDYQNELTDAVTFLSRRGMRVSIYNHQLCVLNQSIWPYARQSISDWKNLYLPECEQCDLREQCGGFFQWATKKHSSYIRPVHLETAPS